MSMVYNMNESNEQISKAYLRNKDKIEDKRNEIENIIGTQED